MKVREIISSPIHSFAFVFDDGAMERFVPDKFSTYSTCGYHWQAQEEQMEAAHVEAIADFLREKCADTTFSYSCDGRFFGDVRISSSIPHYNFPFLLAKRGGVKYWIAHEKGKVASPVAWEPPEVSIQEIVNNTLFNPDNIYGIEERLADRRQGTTAIDKAPYIKPGTRPRRPPILSLRPRRHVTLDFDL